MNGLRNYIAGAILSAGLLGGCASDEKVKDFTSYGFDRPPRVQIVSGVINGQLIYENNPLVRVKPGEKISGTLIVELDNPMDKGAVAPFILTPSWGAPERQFREIPRRTRLGVPPGTSFYEVRLGNVEAPVDKGVNNIYLSFTGVHFADQIASGTHAGTPVDWSKARPLAGLSKEQIEFAGKNGWVIKDIYHKNAGTGQEDYRPGIFGLDSLEVKVE